MIRDPSDGSVKSPGLSGVDPTLVNPTSGLLEQGRLAIACGVRPVLDAGTTGLAPAMTPHQAEEHERLKRSRQWLSDYRTNPERVARLQGETGE